MVRIFIVATAVATVYLFGCRGKADGTQRETKLVIVEAAGEDPAGDDRRLYAAVVKPRIEAVQSFRVAGRIAARLVDVGDRVRAGQVLAKLDATDWALNAQALRGQLASAVAQRDSARADLARYDDLTAQKLMSPAELDRQQHAVSAANAQVTALTAAAREADNKLGYSQLRADADGVVTQVIAEPGQVVSEGAPVMAVARTAEREVEFSVPEQNRGDLRIGQPVEIAVSWAPDNWMGGRVRWIAPTADQATRAFQVRASLDAPPASLGFGVTATARILTEGAPSGRVTLPIAAVFQHHGSGAVWILEQGGGTLRLSPVTVSGLEGNRYVIAAGVKPGDLVVTAGVHRLTAGDRVAPYAGGERTTALAVSH
jgi:RND family efflux transporter MFP subunit